MNNNPWENIKIPIENNSFSGLLADKDNNLELYWAIDYYGNYLFILDLKSNSEINNFPCLNGIDIDIGIIGKKKQVIFKLLSKKDTDIFYILCSDLIKSTEDCNNEKIAIDIIFNRLKKWQYFLKNNMKILDKRQLVGLIGELYFLNNYLFNFFSIEDSLNFWKAPLETSPQDFEIDNISIEVKTISLNKITISSFEQLNKHKGDLYLFTIEVNESLERNETSININQLINRIKDTIRKKDIGKIEHFDNLLFNYGFIPIKEYDELYYIIGDDFFYTISETFPKISTVSIGIENLTYKINLDFCNDFIIKKEYFYEKWGKYGY